MTGSKYRQTQRDYLLPPLHVRIHQNKQPLLTGALFHSSLETSAMKSTKACPSGRERANWRASLSLQSILRKQAATIYHFCSTSPSHDLPWKQNLRSLDFTCRTKCLCLPSSRCKSPLSKWDLNNDRYSFWRLMSVASIKAPIWVSICCLALEK